MTKISRRCLLKQATAGATLLSSLKSPTSAQGQMAKSKNRTPARIRESVDFGWKFNRGDTPGAQRPDFNDAAWKTVNLPHDWSIEGPFSEKEPSGGPGGYLPTGIGCYRKSFDLPASFKDKKYLSSLMECMKTAKCGSTGNCSGSVPLDIFHFSTT